MSQMMFVCLFAALLAVSAQVLPPNQNSATSAADSLNAANLYNQNFYARDESRIRHHTTTFGNSVEGATDVATATSDALPLPALDPLTPHNPHRLSPYPLYGPAVRNANPFHHVPLVSYFSPLYPAYGDVPYPYHAFPYVLPLSQTLGTADDALLSPAVELPPVQFLDPTFLRPAHPQLPAQTLNAAASNFRSLSAAASPFLASSEVLTDNAAYSTLLSQSSPDTHLL